MTEQTKAVFNDPKLLREKLNEFLQTPEKVEIYAQAAEKFYAAGGKMELRFAATWSWWGFFCNIWFLFYRKLNKHGLILLVATFVLGLIPYLGVIMGIVAMVGPGVAGKYFVIKRFEQALDTNNEALFIQMSGVAKWAIWVAVIMYIIGIIAMIAMSFLLGALFTALAA